MSAELARRCLTNLREARLRRYLRSKGIRLHRFPDGTWVANIDDMRRVWPDEHWVSDWERERSTGLWRPSRRSTKRCGWRGWLARDAVSAAARTGSAAARTGCALSTWRAWRGGAA